MTEFEKAVSEAEAMGLLVFDGFEFESGIKGLIIDRFIFISKDVRTEAEKLCVLSEELSHFKVNTGNITDQRGMNNRYQELKAHRGMVRDSLPLERIAEATARLGQDADAYEVAEELGVTVKFLSEAIGVYKAQFGVRAKAGGYEVMFEPFRVKKS